MRPNSTSTSQYNSAISNLCMHQVYNWGEAGYALSRGAIDQITTRFNSSAACQVLF